MTPRYSWEDDGAALSVRFEAGDWAAHRWPILQAAHAFARDVVVRLERSGRGVLLRLAPKKGLEEPPQREAFRENFERELSTQAVRCGIAEANRPVLEHVVSLALRPSAAPQAAPAPGDLTPEQRAEIDRLIAEVEAELRAEDKAQKDPLGITATWEEKHGRRDTTK